MTVTVPRAPAGSPRLGVAHAEAASYAKEAWRSLVQMALALDAADLIVTDDLAGVICNVGEIAVGLVQLADEYGHAAATLGGPPVDTVGLGCGSRERARAPRSLIGSACLSPATGDRK